MLIHIMANNTKMEPWIKRFTVSDEFQQILKATGQLRDEIKEFRQQYQYLPQFESHQDNNNNNNHGASYHEETRQ